MVYIEGLLFAVCTYSSESALQTLSRTFILDDGWLEMKMGTLAGTGTTCARVILMALTGDGSMSTSCCTELSVWTRSNAAEHPHTRTHQSGSMHSQRYRGKRKGLMGKDRWGESVITPVRQKEAIASWSKLSTIKVRKEERTEDWRKKATWLRHKKHQD